MKDSAVKIVGEITKIHGAMYEVTDQKTGIKIMATLSGKMRMHSIVLTVGDVVDVELSMYDLQRGRITYRHK